VHDVLYALAGMGVELVFMQLGVGNNDGYYQLCHWGPLDARWIDLHRDQLLAAIEQG